MNLISADVNWIQIMKSINKKIAINEEYRMQKLLGICMKLSLYDYKEAIMRIKLGYTIGIYYLNSEHFHKADQILMEVIMIFEKIGNKITENYKSTESTRKRFASKRSIKKSNNENQQQNFYRSMILNPIISEFGANSLMVFADSLLVNSKYKYALLALENALEILKVIDKTKYSRLLNKMAVICYENNDLKNSLKYYYQILRGMRKEKKVNEVVFVCEVMTKILVLLGEFQQAKQLVQEVSTFLNFEVSKSNSFKQLNSQYVSLQLTLSEILLKGLEIEKAITLLRFLTSISLPIALKSDTFILLAKVYMKKGWFNEGIECLKEYENEEISKIENPNNFESYRNKSSINNVFDENYNKLKKERRMSRTYSTGHVRNPKLVTVQQEISKYYEMKNENKNPNPFEFNSDEFTENEPVFRPFIKS
ncbi:hypothetical protein M0811_11626 [Anaeramoeba ignava]|uniref:Uncharacterized protein n=1 Tax=Anaeramoeba ignava TaxID=1746090 RepID=A0A9Q0LB35_ANAIG|nr:hypothetical protein M0811_11626 [Anaeramoeba ignava]